MAPRIPDRRLHAHAAGLLEPAEALVVRELLPHVPGAALRLAHLRALLADEPVHSRLPAGWTGSVHTATLLDGQPGGPITLRLEPPGEPAAWCPLILRHNPDGSRVIHPQTEADWLSLDRWRTSVEGQPAVDLLPEVEAVAYTVILVPADEPVAWHEDPEPRWRAVLGRVEAGELPSWTVRVR